MIGGMEAALCLAVCVQIFQTSGESRLKTGPIVPNADGPLLRLRNVFLPELFRGTGLLANDLNLVGGRS